MGVGIAGAWSRVHNPALATIPREGSISTETRRAPLTAFAGLMALALPGVSRHQASPTRRLSTSAPSHNATPSRPSAPMTGGSRAIRWGLSPRTGDFRNALLFGEELF